MNFPLPPDVCCYRHNRGKADPPMATSLPQSLLTPLTLSTVTSGWLSQRRLMTMQTTKNVSHYKFSLSSPRHPSPRSHRTKDLLCPKPQAIRHSSQWHRWRVSAGPLASTLGGTQFLTCGLFVQSGGSTPDSLQGRRITVELWSAVAMYWE